MKVMGDFMGCYKILILIEAGTQALLCLTVKSSREENESHAQKKKKDSSETTPNFGHPGYGGRTASRGFCKLWDIRGNRETVDKCFSA